MSAMDDDAAGFADAPSDEDTAQIVGAKKKRRPKKKGIAHALTEDALAATAQVADVLPVVLVPGDALSDCEGDAIADVAGKKKKKKKKDGCPRALELVDSNSAALKGSDLPTTSLRADSDVEAVDACEEEGDDDGAEAGLSVGKKKKRGRKKKGGSQVMCVGKGVPKYVSDSIWEQWASDALQVNANCADDMEMGDLIRCPSEFNGYGFSGLLRPAFVTPQMRMPSDFLMPDYANDPDGVSLCERNGPKEVPVLEGTALDTMREACRLGREVLDIAARFMKAGTTGDQIDRIVYQACVDRRVYPSPLNYYRFPKSVCVSPNEVICHGIPDCRPIEEGDIVNLDVSIYHEGFHADLNETFFIGDCDEDAQRLVRTAYCSLLAAAQLIRPGTFYRDLGNAIHSEAAKNNCAVVTTYCGHGVGELFHGPPKVPHYRKNKAVGIMRPGHIFTVEPMINLGSNGGDRTWPDSWTAVTKDGKRSAQFEHTFLVTETGVEVLTRRYGSDKYAMPAYDPDMFQL